MTDDIPALPRIVEVAIEPASKDDQDRLHTALARLAAEDPSFAPTTDHESGQTILKGTSEDQIEAKVEILRTSYKINARVGAPQVAFRERPTRWVEHSYTYKRQGGKSDFAAVTLVVEPNAPDKDYEFESRIVNEAVPNEYLPGG
jgi:elongation factor G